MCIKSSTIDLSMSICPYVSMVTTIARQSFTRNYWIITNEAVSTQGDFFMLQSEVQNAEENRYALKFGKYDCLF